jgi:hypothetical protein
MSAADPQHLEPQHLDIYAVQALILGNVGALVTITEVTLLGLGASNRNHVGSP